MAGYRDKRIYIYRTDAVLRIALEHFGGDLDAAREDLLLAVEHGAIKLRYQRNQPGQSLDDYLSQRIRRGRHSEEYERKGLEEYYGPIFDWDGEDATTQGKAEKPSSPSPRKHLPEDDAHLGKRIDDVLKRARDKWPKPDQRPTIRKMAKELLLLDNDGDGQRLNDYKKDTIRQILSGTYKPMKRLRIKGLGDVG